MFFLFFLLLVVGITQNKDRLVGLNKIAILPVAMVGLSLLGVISAFGLRNVLSLSSWIAGRSIGGTGRSNGLSKIRAMGS